MKRHRSLIRIGLAVLSLAAVLLAEALGGSAAAGSRASGAQAQVVHASRLHPRPYAVRPGSRVPAHDLFGTRVFSDARHGFALADARQAQYPACTSDGGARWTFCGPQFHVDAADAPEAVDSVGTLGDGRLYAYGSSVVDVTTNGGRVWWEGYLGDLVVAVVPGSEGDLLAYVQSFSGKNIVVKQWVTRDGGRSWRPNAAPGG